MRGSLVSFGYNLGKNSFIQSKYSLFISTISIFFPICFRFEKRRKSISRETSKQKSYSQLVHSLTLCSPLKNSQNLLQLWSSLDFTALGILQKEKKPPKQQDNETYQYILQNALALTNWFFKLGTWPWKSFPISMRMGPVELFPRSLLCNFYLGTGMGPSRWPSLTRLHWAGPPEPILHHLLCTFKQQNRNIFRWLLILRRLQQTILITSAKYRWAKNE